MDRDAVEFFFRSLLICVAFAPSISIIIYYIIENNYTYVNVIMSSFYLGYNMLIYISYISFGMYITHYKSYMFHCYLTTIIFFIFRNIYILFICLICSAMILSDYMATLKISYLEAYKIVKYEMRNERISQPKEPQPKENEIVSQKVEPIILQKPNIRMTITERRRPYVVSNR